MLNRRICFAFFGITRSLSHTIQSIVERVVEPARAFGDVYLCGHFFTQRNVLNPRSGEDGSYEVNEYKLLNLDSVELEEPDSCLDNWNFDRICKRGDVFCDNFRSLRNLIHQLHSLHRTTELVESINPDFVVFVRPDLLYHDDFTPVYEKMCSGDKLDAFVPCWQWWGGVNDRFSVCGKDAFPAYGKRILAIEEYFRSMNRPLNGEKLLKFALRRRSVKYKPVPLRASRVRVCGHVKAEEFTCVSSNLLHSISDDVKDWVVSKGFWKPKGSIGLPQ
jgi:hypothetical protein